MKTKLSRESKDHPQAQPARPEDEKLPLGASIAYGVQHVLTMYAGLIAVPLIIGQAAHLSSTDTALMIAATFFLGGIVTLIQTLGIPFFGAQLPLVQGVSFDAVATMLAIIAGAATASDGLQTVLGAVIVASVFGVLVAPLFSRFVHFFPQVVTGSLITVIGLSLLPVAMGWAMGTDSSSADYASMGNIGLAALTLVIGLALSKLGIGIISRLSILLSLVIGTIIALAFGKTDFSSVTHSAIFAVPNILPFGMPKFDIASIVSMMIAMLVILTETTADLLAIGEVVNTRIDNKRFSNGLRADMLSGVIAPFFGTFPQSAFAQNIGLVSVTGVKSRYVVAVGGVLLLLMGLFPVLAGVATAIPSSVLGGAGILLFGSVAASGIRMLGSVNYSNNMNLLIVAVTVAVGLIPTAVPNMYEHFPVWFQTIANSGISSAAVVAVLLNYVFNNLSWGNPRDPSVVAAATDRWVHQQLADTLKDGDYYKNGKIFDAGGNKVPIVSERSKP